MIHNIIDGDGHYTRPFTLVRVIEIQSQLADNNIMIPSRDSNSNGSCKLQQKLPRLPHAPEADIPMALPCLPSSGCRVHSNRWISRMFIDSPLHTSTLSIASSCCSQNYQLMECLLWKIAIESEHYDCPYYRCRRL